MFNFYIYELYLLMCGTNTCTSFTLQCYCVNILYKLLCIISFIVEEVPNEDYTIPLSEAEVIAEGLLAYVHI